jgi:hypothetical protein
MVARYGANAEHLALYAQDPKAVYLVRLAWVELTPFGAGWTSARDRLGALRRSCGRRSARGTEGETLHLTDTLQSVREQLADLVETMPSGHDLPAFRAATALLSESG